MTPSAKAETGPASVSALMRFAGKVVVVTGGGSGIGREVATQFAQEAASVVIGDIAVDSGEEVVRDIRRRGGRAIFVQADVSTADGARRLIETAITECGQLDILFNNAGIEISGQITDFPEEDFDRLVAVNLKGVFLCSKYALRHMVKRRSGAIVNTASVASLVAWPNDAVYNATKAGVLLLTKSMAIEYARYAIRVNCVAPGMIDTPMTARALAATPDAAEARLAKGRLHPLGRLGTPWEVGRSVLFLASQEASFVTGALLPVDGGYLAA